MPDKAALIAVLITDRPLCLRCLTARTHLTAHEVESYLHIAENVVRLGHDSGPCRGCGNTAEVFSMSRPE
jgi:hypothetical protein